MPPCQVRVAHMRRGDAMAVLQRSRCCGSGLGHERRVPQSHLEGSAPFDDVYKAFPAAGARLERKVQQICHLLDSLRRQQLQEIPELARKRMRSAGQSTGPDRAGSRTQASLQRRSLAAMVGWRALCWTPGRRLVFWALLGANKGCDRRPWRGAR